MSPSVADAIAAAQAELSRTEPIPQVPLGYGRDLVCVYDLDPNMQELDPFSTLAIHQALWLRLNSPRGILSDDPDYGLDIIGMLHRGTTPQDRRMIEAAITVECRKEDSVSDVVVTVTMGVDMRSLKISLDVTPEDPTLKDFPLVIALVDGRALLEEMAAA